jgi:hypothetical protein
LKIPKTLKVESIKKRPRFNLLNVNPARPKNTLENNHGRVTLRQDWTLGAMSPNHWIGGEFNLSALKSSLENHKFEFLETQYFLPDEIDGYMDESIFDDYVQAYFEVAKKPVYMITGLKIARGSVVESTVKKEVGGDGKVGVDLTAVGAPVTLGPKGEFKNRHVRTVGWGGRFDATLLQRHPGSDKPPSYSANRCTA